MDETREILPIKCEDCGELFTPSRRWQKFCSEKCRNNYHNYNKSSDKVTIIKEEPAIKCPHCLTDDFKMLEKLEDDYYLCNVCAKEFSQ